MSKFPSLRVVLPPVQVVFEPGYLSQPVVQQVYARLLPPAPGSPPPAAPPSAVPAPALTAASALPAEVPHGC